MIRSLIGLLAACLVTSSCMTPRPQATRHYEAADFQPPLGEDPTHEDDLVSVSTFVTSAK
ncbi:MAG: hypothetical protein GY953_45335, partial [bacterium]|nr:hypothetical protein [bacterium]